MVSASVNHLQPPERDQKQQEKLTEGGRCTTSTASSANGKLRVLGLGLTLLLLQLSGLHLLPELLLELLLSELPQQFGIRVFSRTEGLATVRERDCEREGVPGTTWGRTE